MTLLTVLLATLVPLSFWLTYRAALRLEDMPARIARDPEVRAWREFDRG